MHFEFERAKRVRDALDIIAQAMREVVHRVDAPFVAGVMMRGVANAIEHRIAQPDVRRRHVDLRAQRPRAVGELARFHAREEIEVFFDGAIAKRSVFARIGEIRRSVPASDRRRTLCPFDQLFGVLVKLVEIIGGEEWSAAGFQPDVFAPPSRRSANQRRP